MLGKLVIVTQRIQAKMLGQSRKKWRCNTIFGKKKKKEKKNMPDKATTMRQTRDFQRTDRAIDGPTHQPTDRRSRTDPILEMLYRL